MSENVKKLILMDIFAPILKFNGHFCSKNFYMVILHFRNNYVTIFTVYPYF